MTKGKIAVNPEKCSECLCCQLICSFAYTGSFNPEKACIEISPNDGIHFTGECKEGCVLCSRYCAFGAIVHVGE